MGKPSLPKIIIQEGPLPGTEFKLPPREFTIGQDPNMNLAIPSLVVLHRYALIFCQDDQCFVKDLGRSNKT